MDIEASITSLATAPLGELRVQWQRHHPGQICPDRLPRDLLVRSIAWQLQEKAAGGHAPSVARQLERLTAQLARSGDLDLERETRLKPGTQLIREWHERTIRVMVLEEGYLFEDRRYPSLSQIARAITGAKWSGPRFFGLKQRSRSEFNAAGDESDVQR